MRGRGRFLSGLLAPPETGAPPPVDGRRRRLPSWLPWGSPSPSEDRPRRVAPHRLGRSPPAVVLAELGFGVFRGGVPFKSGEAREGPLVEFDSPSEYCRGALPDAALAVFPPARAGGSGPPLLGFLVPTALCSRVPVSAVSGGTEHGRRGVPIPHPYRPRAFSAPRRVQPRRLEETRFPGPLLDGARPGTLRPCFMPQRPWDLPFRAFPSRRAVPPCGGLLLPCGFELDRETGAT